jgi:hypothetical protein
MRNSIVEEAVDTLKANITKAADVLISLLNNVENPSLLRAVANDVIGHVVQFNELQEFETRLAVLERANQPIGRL